MPFDLEGCFRQIDVYPNTGKWQPVFPNPCRDDIPLSGCMEQNAEGKWLPVVYNGIGNLCDYRMEGCIRYNAYGEAYPVLHFAEYGSFEELKYGCCDPRPCIVCENEGVRTPQFIRVNISGVQSTEGICCHGYYKYKNMSDINGTVVCEQRYPYFCSWESERMPVEWTEEYFKQPYTDCSDKDSERTIALSFYIQFSLTFIDGAPAVRITLSAPVSLQGTALYTGRCTKSATVDFTPAAEPGCPPMPGWMLRWYGGSANVEFDF